ncbi:MAG: hypothetical protein H5T69_16440, partial [Chloroflexi bacterium]|nr:hypothetical protein [Chloroflexota bacterium]
MAYRVAFVAAKQPGRVALMQELAKEHPNLEVETIDPDLPEAELIERCGAHEFIILGTRVSQQVLEACPKLRFVQLMSAGFDTFDVPALQRRGVQFANSSAAIAPAVAEHTITLMLAVKHRLIESWQSVQHRRWAGEVQAEQISELSGSTVGLVGLGHIGREVAKRLQGWDIDLVYSDVAQAP